MIKQDKSGSSDVLFGSIINNTEYNTGIYTGI